MRAVGWIVTSYAIVFGALLIPAGKMADRYGRRRVFTAGLALFGLGAVVSATAASLIAVIAGRVVQGIGGAVIVPASLGLLLEVTDAADRVRAVALWSVSNTIGGASGPTVGALVVDWGGWRWTFGFSAVAAVLTWLVGRRHLPRSGAAAISTPIDYTGIVLVAAAMSALTLAVSEGDPWGWTSWRTLGGFAAAAALSALVVVHCRRHPDPILPIGLFRSRVFSIATAASLSFGLAGGVMQLIGVLFLRKVWGYSALGAGLGVTPAPLTASLMAPITGRLASRFGERAVALPGAAIICASLLWYFTQTDATAHYWIEYFPASVLTGIGVSMTFPMLSSAAIRPVAPSHLSVASGTVRTATQLGNAIGAAGLFVILGKNPSALATFHRGWQMLLAAMVATALLLLGLADRRQSSQDRR